MKNFFFSVMLCMFAVCYTTNAQNAKGDWYVGTGDITGVAWTDWAVNPTIGYSFTDDLVIGCSVAQADSSADLDLDFTARYFWKGYFAGIETDGFSTEGVKLNFGKMFAFHNNSIFVDPKVVYDSSLKTTNLRLGFGLKF
jgi:hypothetical protein